MARSVGSSSGGSSADKLACRKAVQTKHKAKRSKARSSTPPPRSRKPNDSSQDKDSPPKNLSDPVRIPNVASTAGSKQANASDAPPPSEPGNVAAMVTPSKDPHTKPPGGSPDLPITNVSAGDGIPAKKTDNDSENVGTRSPPVNSGVQDVEMKAHDDVTPKAIKIPIGDPYDEEQLTEELDDLASTKPVVLLTKCGHWLEWFDIDKALVEAEEESLQSMTKTREQTT